MGLVLVFDMDQTILDSSDPYLFERPNTPEAHVILKQKIRLGLNWNVVNLMKRAAKLRPTGQVSAICLLTNNSSTILVSAVDEVLFEEIGSKGKYKTYRGNANDRTMPDKPYFFDSIMMRHHSSRPKTLDNSPPKRLVDILNMLQFTGIKAGPDSIKDIYFFDDIGTHALRPEFNFMADGKYKDHYIQINPPYHKTLEDITDYRPVLHALAALDREQPTLPPVPAPVYAPVYAPLATPRRRGPVITYYRLPKTPYGGPNSSGKLPSAGPPVPTPYRARSNAKVNENNLGLPPPPQEQSIRKKGTIGRTSLMNAFKPPEGGSRKTRKRRNHSHLRLTRRK